MEKTLSVILCALVITLAGCQQKSAPASEPSPPIESPLQQVELSPTPAPVVPSSTKASKPVRSGASKVSKTTTPRLDALEKRIRRIEDAAKQYGFQF